ncbi:MAG: 4Fe-4S binding protein [Deltaproteobacteria bacterium]|nr:4Fe-4S binding protein [Deltaproteobacteria bacterium]
MNIIARDNPGQQVLMMGNEAIARGAIEADVHVCAAYPGTPSTEVTGALSRVGKDLGIYVEWSVNEKVALEVAAAASLAGLRGLTAMKQNGINVASDFLFEINLAGSRGGLLIVVCDDPGALSSPNEEDSRAFAKMADLPLLEPATFQEAKDMTKWAFDLSEETGTPVMMRSVTRVSHARGNVQLGAIPQRSKKARFDTTRPVSPLPMHLTHGALHRKLDLCREKFEASPFNSYLGPEHPELLIITSGAGWMYSLEAMVNLKVEDRVGILKLGTTWPLPEQFLLNYMEKAGRILFVEEVDPFLEDNVGALCSRHLAELGQKDFLGKASGTIPDRGELDPDMVIEAIQSVLEIPYEAQDARYAHDAGDAVSEYAPVRQMSFCAGCPHRATFWAIKNALALDGRDGFVLGDIGCYSLGIQPAGYGQLKSVLAMGSGAGLASGFGQLKAFGLDQPVLAACGDSTFYHAAIPALINARYNGADFLMLILDNNATAMTGFQPHPGTGLTAAGMSSLPVDIQGLCEAIGAKVEIADPFDIHRTTETLLRLLQEEEGLRALILRRECALVRAKREKALYKIHVDPEKCIGDRCGCNRLCTRVFKCPGLYWDTHAERTGIDEAICTGCGVCADICPRGAIVKER